MSTNVKYLKIAYDKTSGKAGVVIPYDQYCMDDGIGVYCFFNITNSLNDFQTYDSHDFVDIGLIPHTDPFVLSRIKVIADRNKLDEQLRDFLISNFPTAFDDLSSIGVANYLTVSSYYSDEILGGLV